MKKVLLIYNPMAGGGQFKLQLDTVINLFQEAGEPLTLYRLNHLDALEPMLKDLDGEAYGKIIFAGGDGTLHQGINAVLKAGLKLPVGFFPFGTANDFSQFFSLGTSVEDICQVLIEGHTVPCDIGVANGHYFINVASLGHLIDISQRVDLQMKNMLGVIAYYLKGLEEIPQMRPVRIKLESLEQTLEEEVFFVLIMNGSSAGGFKKIAPAASICDGYLDVCVFKKCPALDIMPLIVQVASGEHINSPYVTYFKTKGLTVHCDEKVGTDLDGELGVGFPMEISVIPGALQILSPKSPVKK